MVIARSQKNSTTNELKFFFMLNVIVVEIRVKFLKYLMYKRQVLLFLVIAENI